MWFGCESQIRHRRSNTTKQEITAAFLTYRSQRQVGSTLSSSRATRKEEALPRAHSLSQERGEEKGREKRGERVRERGGGGGREGEEDRRGGRREDTA